MSANELSAVIYGDSLMKGTVLDSENKYRATARPLLTRITEKYNIKITNRAHFGFTVERGSRLLENDLKTGLSADYALLEYGGNDSDFDWAAVSAEPDGEHQPKTPLADFTKTLGHMCDVLVNRGIKPVLMTLPPMDPVKYLAFIGHLGVKCDNILSWLGDCEMMYRFHESYSLAIAKLAALKKLPLVDVRSYFLPRHDFKSLIGPDGIHASALGYELIYSAFDDYLSALPA